MPPVTMAISQRSPTRIDYYLVNKMKAEFDSDGNFNWKFELETGCSMAKSKPLGIHV
jgi:hypothetical protein